LLPDRSNQESSSTLTYCKAKFYGPDALVWLPLLLGIRNIPGARKPTSITVTDNWQ
jgi:hypothetical protein